MSGKIITFLNFKGGVGKTTLAANISRALMEKEKKRVIVLDLDPQFNLTQILFKKSELDAWEDKQTVLRLFEQEIDGVLPMQNAKRAPSPDNLSKLLAGSARKDPCIKIVPGTFSLLPILFQGEHEHQRSADIFYEFLDICKNFYDYIIIDLNPSVNRFTHNAISRADHVLTPVKEERFSYQGIKMLQEYLKLNFKHHWKNPNFFIFLMNMIDPNKLNSVNAVESTIRRNNDFKNNLLNSKIFETKYLKYVHNGYGTIYDADSIPKTPGKFSPHRREYIQIKDTLEKAAREIVERVEG